MQARAWGALPYAGGLRDQPVGVLERMATAENVYRAVKAWHSAVNWAQWSRDNPSDYEIMQHVITLRGD